MERAETLSGVKFSCDPRPLRIDELEEFFVDTAKARDPQSNRRFEIAEMLDRPDEAVKIVLAGHSGTGKSTELAKFASDHASYHSAVFSIRQEANLSNVTAEQLLILAVERVLESVKDLRDEIDAKVVENVYDWFAEVFEKREDAHSGSIAVETEAGAKGSFFGLLRLGAMLKADMRAGAQMISTKITRENRRIAELAARCGTVIREVDLALRKRNKELLLVIEDLDKAPIRDAERLFFDEPGPLADLPCKAIYTFPVFLQCSPRRQSLDPRFHLTTLPMIKVRDLDFKKNVLGVQTMKKILGLRMDLGLIVTTALDEAIDKTGGVPRDLFDVMVSAASVARQAFQAGDRQAEVIESDDVRYGLNRRRASLLASISTELLPDVYRSVTVEQMYARLEEYGERAQVNPPSDAINLALMQAHALIEYNGERWFRVHPLIAEHVQSLPKQ